MTDIKNNTSVFFENYEEFMTEHKGDFTSSNDFAAFQASESSRSNFLQSLLEGVDDPLLEQNLSTLFEAQAFSVLTESAGGTSLATPWAVAMYPILFDVYHDSTIIQVANVYKVDKPVLSVPRIRIKAYTTDMNGNVTQDQFIPYPGKAARLNVVDVPIATTGSPINIFASTAVDKSIFRINRTFTYLSKISVTETAIDPNTGTPLPPETKDVECNITFDVRSQIAQEIKMKDADGKTVSLKLYSNIDFEEGNINPLVGVWDVMDSASTFVLNSGVISVKFTPYNTLMGRTTVKIHTENIDVMLEQNEDFLINITEEQIQDFTSIFNVNLLRLLSEGIKKQIMLQKDYDLAFALKTSELAIADNGARFNVDLDNFKLSGGEYTPRRATDVLNNILPYLSGAVGVVKRNFGVYPTYILAGMRTAAALRSLQEVALSIPELKGDMGWRGATAQFMKLKILESFFIDEDKMYLTTKAPSGALEQSTIVDFIYQPLYIIKEITDGNTRHFVRTRTKVQILRTDGLAMVNIANLSSILGQS